MQLKKYLRPVQLRYPTLIVCSQGLSLSMKTQVYDQIMPQDECKAIRRTFEQSIVAEN